MRGLINRWRRPCDECAPDCRRAPCVDPVTWLPRLRDGNGAKWRAVDAKDGGGAVHHEPGRLPRDIDAELDALDAHMAELRQQAEEAGRG